MNLSKINLILFLLFAFFFFKSPANAIEINTITPKVAELTNNINESVIGEQIKDFRSDIKINQDGSMEIRETIKYFFDTDRHGIYRYIPFTLYDNGIRYDMEFKFGDVTDEKGTTYKSDIYKEDEKWVLKIGDPDRTITGDHTYIIPYSVKGGLRYFDTHDELYWNITGNGWTIPIRKTRTFITLPQKISESDVKIACYTGPQDSTKTNCIGRSDGSSANFETTIFLNSYEGLTIAYSFPKGIVDVLKPVEFVPFSERWYGKLTILGIILGAIFWYLLLPIYLVVKWYRVGRDPFVGIPVTATYDPPRVEERTQLGAGPPKVDNRNLTPAEAGALLDEHVNRRDVFATVVDLARRGHLKISEQKNKDLLFTKTVPKAKDTLLDFETTLLNGIFESMEVVNVKEVKLYPTTIKVEEKLYDNLLVHKYFVKNPKKTRSLYYALGGAALFTFNLVLAFVAFLFGRHMPAKTIEGAKASVMAKGLKNYLTSQERQLNFQGDKQMLFEKLLPYAVAFGVEKQWAKRFEKFDLKNPDWYEGSSGTTFRSAVFASHLSNSYNSFSSSATPPSSSSSSGFSGGSAGGGGGGGGGGSW